MPISMFSCGKEVLLFFGIIQCFTHSDVEAYISHIYHRHGNQQHGNIWESLDNLSDRILALEGHEHEEAHDHHAVLFVASLSEGNVASTGVPIVYDQVDLNREEGYNSTSGVFTCPIAGVYFFTYSSLPAPGVATSVAILKNGDKLSSIQSALPSGSSQQAERSELLFLKKGDEVFVELEEGSLLSESDSLKFTGFRVSD